MGQRLQVELQQEGREGWMQPRAAFYFQTLGMALSQLLWASGSSSVKWGRSLPTPTPLQGPARSQEGRRW